MELLVFGHSGSPVIVFPTRQGRFFDYENWGLTASLLPSVQTGLIQLFCVDSVDSETFYCKCTDHHTRIARHNQYEQYILDEVLPLIREVNASDSLIAHGCSIGAFHAANIGLRHPSLFRKVVAISGRFDLTRPAGRYPDLFDGQYSEDIYFHTPNHFLTGLTDGSVLQAIAGMELFFAVGEGDHFRDSNIDLSGALSQKNVPHRLDIWGGVAHNPGAWREMIPVYL